MYGSAHLFSFSRKSNLFAYTRSAAVFSAKYFYDSESERDRAAQLSTSAQRRSCHKGTCGTPLPDTCTGREWEELSPPHDRITSFVSKLASVSPARLVPSTGVLPKLLAGPALIDHVGTIASRFRNAHPVAEVWLSITLRCSVHYLSVVTYENRDYSG